jgi:hypothetical protein
MLEDTQMKCIESNAVRFDRLFRQFAKFVTVSLEEAHKTFDDFVGKFSTRDTFAF